MCLSSHILFITPTARNGGRKPFFVSHLSLTTTHDVSIGVIIRQNLHSAVPQGRYYPCGLPSLGSGWSLAYTRLHKLLSFLCAVVDFWKDTAQMVESKMGQCLLTISPTFGMSGHMSKKKNSNYVVYSNYAVFSGSRWACRTVNRFSSVVVPFQWPEQWLVYDNLICYRVRANASEVEYEAFGTILQQCFDWQPIGRRY